MPPILPRRAPAPPASSGIKNLNIDEKTWLINIGRIFVDLPLAFSISDMGATCVENRLFQNFSNIFQIFDRTSKGIDTGGFDDLWW